MEKLFKAEMQNVKQQQGGVEVARGEGSPASGANYEAQKSGKTKKHKQKNKTHNKKSGKTKPKPHPTTPKFCKQTNQSDD